MSDDKPSAFQDVRKGLGLLFRAARTVAERLPTKDVEDVVTTSAREVGRAFESVAATIERAVLGKPGTGKPGEPPPSEPAAPPSPPKDEHDPSDRT